MVLKSVVTAFCVAGTTLAACGDPQSEEPLPPVPHIGSGPRYRPPAGRLADAGRPIRRLRCTRAAGKRFGVHLEIFANRLDVVIPAGIGVALPRTRDGAYVKPRGCSYPVRTLEPTGLMELAEGASLTLGDFFEIWGQPLSSKRLLSFRAARGRAVSAYVDGVRRRGDPRAIPLAPHAAIVLEVNGYFPPTKRYRFPSGL